MSLIKLAFAVVLAYCYQGQMCQSARNSFLNLASTLGIGGGYTWAWSYHWTINHNHFSRARCFPDHDQSRCGNVRAASYLGNYKCCLDQVDHASDIFGCFFFKHDDFAPKCNQNMNRPQVIFRGSLGVPFDIPPGYHRHLKITSPSSISSLTKRSSH